MKLIVEDNKDFELVYDNKETGTKAYQVFSEKGFEKLNVYNGIAPDFLGGSKYFIIMNDNSDQFITIEVYNGDVTDIYIPTGGKENDLTPLVLARYPFLYEFLYNNGVVMRTWTGIDNVSLLSNLYYNYDKNIVNKLICDYHDFGVMINPWDHDSEEDQYFVSKLASDPSDLYNMVTNQMAGLQKQNNEYTSHDIEALKLIAEIKHTLDKYIVQDEVIE